MARLLVFMLLFGLLISPPVWAQEEEKKRPVAEEKEEPAVKNITQNRLIEEAGLFAYTAPEGWYVAEMKGAKYKIALTTPVKGFAPNINLLDDEYKGSIDEYLRKNLEELEKGFEDFKSLGQSTFVTTSSVKGVKVVTQAKQQGALLRQVFYVLRGKGNRKFIITFTALAEEGTKYDAVVEKAIKTFVLK